MADTEVNAVPAVAPEDTAPKPWEQEWIQKPVKAMVQAVEETVQEVKGAVEGIKMPWDMPWKQKATQPTTAAVQAPVEAPTDFDVKGFLPTLRKAEYGSGKVQKNPNSSALGPYQFTLDTWKRMTKLHNLPYKPADRLDEAKSAEVAALYTQYNVDKFKKDFKRMPTAGEAYTYHFLGEIDGKSMVSASANTPAKDHVSAAAVKKNMTIFFNREGKRFTTPRTAGEVRDILSTKVRKA